MVVITLKIDDVAYGRKLVADEGKLIYQFGMENQDGFTEIVIPISWNYEELYFEKEIPEEITNNNE